jgi:NAD(P)-dependent dehydrogenase (short-subunit alcohol dehydrogenase family)
LATTSLLLSLGARVVVGDLQPPPVPDADLTFVETNVADWAQLVNLFDVTISKHGCVNHCFANAGISSRTDYTKAQYGPDGSLLEPSHLTLDVNLRGMINTAYLAIHHMKNNGVSGGSIVCTASASSFQRFSATDYATAKHGVLGFVRGMVQNLNDLNQNLRINAVSPSWTTSGLVSESICQAAGVATQPPSAVARSVAFLMAGSSSWHGSVIYSKNSKFVEVEESVLLPAGLGVVGGKGEDEETIFRRIKQLRRAAERQ